MKGEIMSERTPDDRPAGAKAQRNDPAHDTFEQALSSSNPEDRTRWTPAVFLDNAQELRRRLAVWHVPHLYDEVPPFPRAELAIRKTFRSVVMQRDHGARPGPGLELYFGGVSKEDANAGIDGIAFEGLPSDQDKELTLWVLRDFFEHLPDAGSGEQAKYLRLTVDRILDSQIYRRRKPVGDAEKWNLKDRNAKGDEGPYSHVGGKKFARPFLDNLVVAAKSLLDTSIRDTQDTVQFGCVGKKASEGTGVGDGNVGGKPKKKRGRPRDTDPTADERMVDAWKTGQYPTYAALAQVQRTTKHEVEAAIDRHRHRINSRKQAGNRRKNSG
jgi:hypothetical protein